MAENGRGGQAALSEEAAELSYLQQLYQGQYEELGGAVNEAMQKLGDLNRIKETLEKQESLKNRNMLSPVGSGVYVNAKVESVDTVLVNVGANYFVEEKIDDAKQFVSRAIEAQTRHINSLLKSRDELESALIEVSMRMERLAQG